MSSARFAVAILLLVSSLGERVLGQDLRILKDLEYAQVDDTALKLDLYVPAKTASPPVVVWVHGGAWRGGSKSNPPILPLTAKGFAVASIDYRLSPVARFPAQIHDIKAAIRYLRATAATHGIAAASIAISGGSAGGHLAALAGVSNGVKDLDGNLGNHGDESSDVQAIVVFYGASNLTTILAQSTPHGLNVRVPALDLLLTGELDETKAKVVIDGFGRGLQPQPYDLAPLASPVFHVDKTDPPLLWFHGDQDPQMPINQAHEMIGVYKKAGLAATLEVVYGGAHGGKLFYTPDQVQQVTDFLIQALK